MQVGGVTTNFGQGSAQVTGKATNLMISGDGFFMVKRGSENLFTRAGAFDFDSAGNLVTPDGDIVQGYAADARPARSPPSGDPEPTSPSRTWPTRTPTNPLKSYNIGPTA